MKAIVLREYGGPDVLHVEDVKTPVPKPNEILIRIRAASVNFGDRLIRNFKSVSPARFSMPFPLWIPTRVVLGIAKPKVRVTGSEFAGEVAALGNQVKRFKEGDSVFGYRGITMGTHAEYLCMPADGVVARKPSTMTYEEAATVPYGATTALSLLGKVDLQPEQDVLINGASGAIGSHALQLAKWNFGTRVTGVCGTQRMEFVKSLGADRVIDYTKEDFTENGETYDLIFDVLRKTSFRKCRRSLSPEGRYLLASFKTGQLVQMLWTGFRKGKKVVCALSDVKGEDLEVIKDLIEDGKMKAMIDRRFPLEEAAEAHRYLEGGERRGNVVLTIT